MDDDTNTVGYYKTTNKIDTVSLSSIVNYNNDGLLYIDRLSNNIRDHMLTFQNNINTIISNNNTIFNIKHRLGINSSSPGNALDVVGNVDIVGNLNIAGNINAINIDKLDIADKLLILNSALTSTDDDASGGGISLKGATDKSILWTGVNTGWTFSENITSKHIEPSNDNTYDLGSSSKGYQRLYLKENGIDIKGKIINVENEDITFPNVKIKENLTVSGNANINENIISKKDLILNTPTSKHIIHNTGSGDVILKKDNTQYGSLTNNAANLIIKSGSTTAATFTGANVLLAGTVDITGKTSFYI